MAPTWLQWATCRVWARVHTSSLQLAVMAQHVQCMSALLHSALGSGSTYAPHTPHLPHTSAPFLASYLSHPTPTVLQVVRPGLHLGRVMADEGQGCQPGDCPPNCNSQHSWFYVKVLEEQVWGASLLCGWCVKLWDWIFALQLTAATSTADSTPRDAGVCVLMV